MVTSDDLGTGSEHCDISVDVTNIAARVLGNRPTIPLDRHLSFRVRGRRLAVEHVLAMLAAGDEVDTILEGYPWLEREDVLACIEYARRLVGHEQIEPFDIDKKSA